MIDDDDLEDVRREEGHRGRRPVDIAARRRHLKLLNGFRITLQNGDEETFKELLIHEIGLLPGTQEYKDALKKWRSLRGTSS